MKEIKRIGLVINHYKKENVALAKEIIEILKTHHVDFLAYGDDARSLNMREISAEEREEMEAHAQTCEACRALLDHADVLSGMQHIDEDVTVPESFKTGWRSAIRQTPRVISIGDWMRRKGARVVGYAACAALVFAAGAGVGRLGGNEKNEARTAYDYDYGAYDTYEVYPQENAVALYENSAPALGARSAAEKGAANDSTAEDEKKIVRNAWLTLKTERFDEAVSALWPSPAARMTVISR